VLDQVGAQHGGLGGEVWVEVLAGEPGQRCVQRRVGQREVGFLRNALGRLLEDGFGNEEEVGQLQLDDAHRQSRSRARSFCWMARPMRMKKAWSARRRRTAALSVRRGGGVAPVLAS